MRFFLRHPLLLLHRRRRRRRRRHRVVRDHAVLRERGFFPFKTYAEQRLISLVHSDRGGAGAHTRHMRHDGGGHVQYEVRCTYV